MDGLEEFYQTGSGQGGGYFWQSPPEGSTEPVKGDRSGPLSDQTADNLGYTHYYAGTSDVYSNQFSSQDLANVQQASSSFNEHNCILACRNNSATALGDPSINTLPSYDFQTGSTFFEILVQRNQAQPAGTYIYSYNSSNVEFSFNGNIAQSIRDQNANSPGVYFYTIGVGDGYHTMFLSYDNTSGDGTFTIFDQGTMWVGESKMAVVTDVQLNQMLGDVSGSAINYYSNATNPLTGKPYPGFTTTSPTPTRIYQLQRKVGEQPVLKPVH